MIHLVKYPVSKNLSILDASKENTKLHNRLICYQTSKGGSFLMNSRDYVSVFLPVLYLESIQNINSLPHHNHNVADAIICKLTCALLNRFLETALGKDKGFKKCQCYFSFAAKFACLGYDYISLYLLLLSRTLRCPVAQNGQRSLVNSTNKHYFFFLVFRLCIWHTIQVLLRKKMWVSICISLD